MHADGTTSQGPVCEQRAPGRIRQCTVLPWHARSVAHGHCSHQCASYSTCLHALARPGLSFRRHQITNQATLQGFPDYYAFVGTGGLDEKRLAALEALAPCAPLATQLAAQLAADRDGGDGARRRAVASLRQMNRSRYLQDGNAVSPCLSAAVGTFVPAVCSTYSLTMWHC